MLSTAVVSNLPMFAAGWSFPYLLLGGGVGGAFLLFIALKTFGK